MNVKILASGSAGNCIHIQSGSTSILVDVGIPKTKIEKRLIEAGIDPTQLDYIFITHAHADHTKGLPLANKYRIPVYAAHSEWNNIQSVDENLMQIIDSPISFDYGCGGGGFDVFPFSTHHDAYDPLGYAFMFHSGGKISICLDTGKVDSEMLGTMSDSDIYIIEANHEPDLLELSKRPDSVKARILSDIGHLSNEQAAEALLKLVKGRGERIYLTHLSGEANSPALAEMTVRQALRRKGLQVGIHYHLEVC
ncbi:putative metallo-hydrolase YycJ [Paenibacillus sp. J31TS4]|uniref:MBL fold metallo-hydrolase n=1 Tax=Paenibacillus sp. J31TS4 TaxID=2807195 RepID=UPI001B1C3DD7|nr:MBL fold metallo-hydrolase [Paenibacillus sp. J31TS4]GIP38602.1 putative metallo-hydrolase YycJ [Paenibacillus sp. J31TS4]